MPTSLAKNRSARDAVMSRVRDALGKKGDRASAREAAQTYIGAHAQGPRPSMPSDLVDRFMTRAAAMESTVERVIDRRDLPGAVARYLDRIDAAEGGDPKSLRTGVCWPELGDLDWSSAGLDLAVRPTVGADRLGITGTFCAIAETGTLVVLTGADTPTASALLVDTHIAVVRADRIVSGMEEVFALIRLEHGQMPRAVNLISGPSRTGDIEQTIVVGAHGPIRVHVLVLGPEISAS